MVRTTEPGGRDSRQRVRQQGISPPSVFANFRQGFAVNAQIRCRTRFQTANADLHAAGFAVAEVFVFNFFQRFLDLLISLRSRSRLRSSRLVFLGGTVYCRGADVAGRAGLSYYLHPRADPRRGQDLRQPAAMGWGGKRRPAAPAPVSAAVC